MTPRLAVWLAALLVMCGPLTAQAQMAESAVTGTGAVDIKKQPDAMRVQVDLVAKGKDLKEALAKLKQRRDAATNQLVALGVDKSALTFAEPGIATDQSSRQRERQMEMMVRARTGGRAKKPDAKSAAAPPVMVAQQLKADLPLKGASIEELLEKAHTLQEKIKAADLAGLKETEKLSPQEEEQAEETKAMEEMMMGNTGEPQRGEPVFLFVSKITEAERDKAMAEAFQKAKAEAQRLAKAAGAELGKLNTLHATAAAGNEGYDEYDAYASRGYYRAMQQAAGRGDSSEATEAIGGKIGKVGIRVSVTASFTMK